MGNVYFDKQRNLHVMEVEYGWGMDLNAIEFPVELAICGLETGLAFLKKYPKSQRPDISSMIGYCLDVIENHKKGERTYILEGFWGEQVNIIKNIIKSIKKPRPYH